MLVSLITVCYNSEQTIRKTIESVLAQTYDNIEYIIVDGKSSDKTLDVVKEYEERIEKRGYKLKVVSEKDNGIYDAMNKGIALSSGELVGIINSDDWYEPNAVETAVSTYKDEAFDMFYADINLVKENGKVMVKRSKLDRFPTSRHWNHPTTFVKKSVYDELGAFRCEGIHDDYDFVLRVRRAKKKVVIKNVVLANFKTGGVSNKKSIKNSFRRVKDRYRCYRNNGYSFLYIFECLAIETAKFILS